MRIAVGLAVLGGLLALVNEYLSFRRSHTVDWGHVALALGVPALVFGIARSTSGRK